MMGTAENNIARPAALPRVGYRKLLLPPEHGSWSFLLEPIAAAAATAYSAASPTIALMAAAFFFSRQPFRMYLKLPRGVPARSTALLLLASFLLLGAGSLAVSVWIAGPWVLYPLAVAAPFAVQQSVLDLKSRRNLLAELLAAIAVTSSSAAIALAGGAGWPHAIALWTLFVCRFIPSILYIRSRLDLEKGKPHDTVLPSAAHAIGFVIVLALAVFGLASYLAAGVLGFLFARCVIGLSRYRTPMKAMQLGIREVIYGAAFVASVIAGHYAAF